MIDIYEFQEDLRKGMSISDACREHEITFQKAVEMLQYKSSMTSKGRKKKNHKRVTSSPEPHIYVRDDTYTVRKSLKGKTRMFGTYNSLEDAIRMREALKEDGWHQTHVDRICDELGIHRRKGYINEKVRYH